MADNVSISFGADTTGFLDGVARVSAALSKIDEAARACGASQQDVARTNLVAINGEIAAEQMAFAQKQSLYGQLTRLKLMTGEERVVAAKAALDAEYAAESALLQKEAQIEGLRPSQRQAVLGRMTLLDQKYAADSQRLMLQSVEQMVAPMNHMVDAMSASFSSSLTGMIMGTKNLQQAMRSLTQAVVSQFVRMGVEVVADWAKKQLAMAALSLAGEGQKTAAASAGAAARTGISAGEAAAGEATVFASILRNITASASETFAGVFGFLAPVMGPAAAAPAAAAQGAVLSVAAFDIGAWSIPQDQLAMVHQNELIMPAAEAGAFRSMLNSQANGGSQAQSAGDTHVHLNVSAMDAASVKSWLGANSRQIMKAMSQAVSNGDHLGLRRLAR
ncbi:hypothetical protein SAMN06265338_101732 [Rhodoblastus acidophilus]|uniref:Phage tail tape measure protein n=2 Tax=Rhodoblastus acidophilus TaxID=1074 RepID=A0A212QL53_RHOAC|nr:hypothetical protein [Rhodoblastus acidophilus]MCW2317597.1 hypothetical protein [Rhodoblastus acidophilus]PPQ39867.1 hypothetical protein CKO16_03425 [Rhodoblastus acidophilus]SNB60107.1 hypothetical protein SAMN06265338_101732 [Rhodoblastus acidophilus]